MTHSERIAQNSTVTVFFCLNFFSSSLLTCELGSPHDIYYECLLSRREAEQLEMKE